MSRTIGMLAAIAFAFTACSKEPSATPSGETSDQLYVTWNTLESDKLASIWLIKRFVTPEAQFSFVSKNTPITNGIPFDTPASQFRRYHSLSCYQSILRHYDITNASLLRIGDLTHDIEINFWGEKRFQETIPLQKRVSDIVEQHPDSPNTCVKEALPVFDELYKQFSVEG